MSQDSVPQPGDDLPPIHVFMFPSAAWKLVMLAWLLAVGTSLYRLRIGFAKAVSRGGVWSFRPRRTRRAG